MRMLYAENLLNIFVIFDPFWSINVHLTNYDPLWSILILIYFNSFWSILIYLVNYDPFRSILIRFDLFWSNSIHLWSKYPIFNTLIPKSDNNSINVLATTTKAGLRRLLRCAALKISSLGTLYGWDFTRKDLTWKSTNFLSRPSTRSKKLGKICISQTRPTRTRSSSFR